MDQVRRPNTKVCGDPSGKLRHMVWCDLLRTSRLTEIAHYALDELFTRFFERPCTASSTPSERQVPWGKWNRSHRNDDTLTPRGRYRGILPAPPKSSGYRRADSDDGQGWGNSRNEHPCPLRSEVRMPIRWKLHCCLLGVRVSGKSRKHLACSRHL